MRTVLAFAVSLRGSIVDHAWKNNKQYQKQQTTPKTNENKLITLFLQQKLLHTNNQKRQTTSKPKKINMSTMRTVLAFAVSLRGSIVDHTFKNKQYQTLL